MRQVNHTQLSTTAASGLRDGALIEAAARCTVGVIAVHPNQVKATRPRYSAAGGKSDSFDSFALAELARADGHRFGARLHRVA
jgi:hypothetical protein